MATADGTTRALLASGDTGWALVEHAQQLVHRGVDRYSCLRWWESPERAFARGAAFCVQYNGVLAAVLRSVGVEARTVHAVRVRVADDPAWRGEHVWVRARVDGEERDVCAGRSANRPGAVGFVPVTPVRPFGGLVRGVAVVGMALLVEGSRAWAGVRGRPTPEWLDHPMER